MNLGETIYRLRTKQGMSQDALAEALDVSRQSVSKWENNAAVPELEKLIKISDLFGVTLDALVGREEAAPSSPAPEVPPAPAHPLRRTVGIILLCFGLLNTLILTILGGLILGLLAGLPFTIVGSILMSDTREPLFTAAWGIFAVYAPLANFFILNFIGYGLYIRYWVIGIWLAVMTAWALWLHRRGKLSAESRKFVKGALITALVLTILLGIGSSIYYRQTGLMSANEELDSLIAATD